jgi:DNA-binding transcriptional regulator YiaG
MNNEKFEELLKKAQLSKKEFAELVKMNYTSVTNWSQKDKKVPYWIKEFLALYIENRELKSLKTSILHTVEKINALK